MNRAGIILLLLIAAFGCEKDDTPSFNADFNYEFLSGDSANFVRFRDISQGHYLLSEWDFGNGQRISNKSEVTVYYPTSGEYTAGIAIYSYDHADSIKKTIVIEEDDLVLDFSVTPSDTNSNYVTVKNLSGSLDSFSWIYKDQRTAEKESLLIYYPFPGTYTVKLVGTKHGISDTIEKSINITSSDPGYLKSFRLVWSDEFDGPTINRDWWTFETGAGGWGNQELQNYTDGANAEVVDGRLIITAKKLNDNKLPGSYSSSRIITKDKKEFRYGRMEIRAKLPEGRGIWPAIWMLGSNISSVGWPACGEVDIMEYVGYKPGTVHTTIHTPSSYGNSVNTTEIPLESCEEEFHVYGMIWTERYMKFYIDQIENITYTYSPPIKNNANWPFNQPMFFILNIAVGGTWGGAEGIDNTIFPQQMEVDYVRVYQAPSDF